MGIIRDRNGRGAQIAGWEWAFALALTVAAVALYSFDLDSYKYSYVGDEWGFYAMARDIALGRGAGTAHIFSEAGVYGDGPMMDSYYQGAVMWFAGVHNFGFRFSSVLAAAASLLPFYLFIRLTASAPSAVAGTFCLSFSHYFIAWAHNGHNDNHIFFPLTLALCLFALAYARKSRFLFALCGLAAGLGFYTYYTARLVLPLVLLMFILWRPGWRFLLAFLLVFALAVTPLLLNGPAKLWEDISGRWLGHDDWQAGDQAMKVARHVGLSLLSPLTFDGWGHGYFVAGGLFDPITMLLFSAGVLSSLWHISGRRGDSARRRLSAFLLAGYFISAAAVGATTPYPKLSVTRQLVLVPLVCALAGVGAAALWGLLRRIRGRGRSWRFCGAAAAGACIIWLNLHRLYVEMPLINGLHPLCLATKYVQEKGGDVRYYYILPEGTSFWARFQLQAYGLDDRVTVYQPRDIFEDPGLVVPPCDVIVSDMNAGEAGEIADYLQERLPVTASEVLEGPPGGPWKKWGNADIRVISIGGRDEAEGIGKR